MVITAGLDARRPALFENKFYVMYEQNVEWTVLNVRMKNCTNLDSQGSERGVAAMAGEPWETGTWGAVLVSQWKKGMRRNRVVGDVCNFVVGWNGSFEGG